MLKMNRILSKRQFYSIASVFLDFNGSLQQEHEVKVSWRREADKDEEDEREPHCQPRGAAWQMSSLDL